MEKLKSIFSFTYFVAMVVLSLVLIGCGSTTRVIEREVKVPYEVTIKDTIALKDTVILGEGFWYGEVVDSLNNVIGNLKVYYSRKIAELDIKKIDTVTVKDTIYVEKPIGDFLDKASSDFSLTDKIILYAIAGMAAIILLLRKKKK